MSVNPELRDKIERISNLPTLPQIASRLLSIINDTETNASDVASLVGQDVSLSAKIVRLANSAFYGTPRAISTIQTAVVRLGFKVINTMVLSLTVFDMFPSGGHTARFDRKAFWKHCVRCGLLAKLLAEKSRSAGIDPEEAFCAGLLHDIGKVVMEQYLHEDFAAALDHAREAQIAFYAAEKETLEYDHTDVAAWLTSRWELPETLLNPITSHHAPAGTRACEGIVSVCHCADHLCYAPDIAQPDNGIQPSLCNGSLETAGLDERMVVSVKESFAGELEKTGALYEMLGGG